MTDKDEEAPGPAVCANLLSGKSLLQVHMNTGKSLPKEGSKDFSPNNSWMERKQIQSILDERKELLEVERVEKWGCLSVAVWDHKKKLAEVTRRTGKHFQTLGFERDGALFLYPEEALFLLETNSLELTFGGVPVSIQQGYALLLGSSTGCDLNEYRTYSHLLRQGYKLLRCTNKIVHTKYERTIRLDQYAPVKRKHLIQTSDESGASRKIKKDPCLTLENNLLGHPKETDVNTADKGSQNSTDAPENAGGEIQLKVLKKEFEKDSVQGKSSKEDMCVDSQEPVKMQDQTEEKRNLQRNSLATEKPEIENDFTHVGHKTQGLDLTHEEQIVTSLNEQSEADQIITVPNNIANDDYVVIDSHEQGAKISLSEEDNQISDDGAKTKAYDIAESLFSLGSVIVGKKSNTENSSDPGTNLNDTLQSEIMKVLGAHIETDISKEALTAVASSAASTILSHISSEDTNNSNKYFEDRIVPLKAGGDNLKEQSEKLLIENSTSQSSLNLQEVLEQCSDNISATGKNVVEENENLAVNKNDDVSMNSSSPRNICSDFDNEICIKTSQDKKRPASPNEENNLSSAVCVKKIKTADSLIEYPNEIDNPSQDPSTLGKKSDRSSEASEDEECSPNRVKVASEKNVGKNCDALQNVDPEVEIIDVVPEKKIVELVNLSDESSLDNSVTGFVVKEYEKGGIEVIDVRDTSSAESSDSDSTSSITDDSEIVEEKIYTWDQERKKILDTIPDMYNLSEISIKPPPSALLPENVKPQRSCYQITRRGLLNDNKERFMTSLPTTSSHTEQTNNFNAQAPSFWQQPGPVPDFATVQAIAQLILPMLGLPPHVYPSNRAWMPHNPWFAPQPAWITEPRFDSTHGRKWTNSPRGNWSRRQHFALRFPRGARGNRRFRSRPNYFKNFSPRFPYQRRGSNFNYNQNHFGHLQSQTPNNEFFSLESPPQNESDDSNDVPSCSTKKNDTNEMRPWTRIKGTEKANKKRCLQNRYFNPPKKYSHMKQVLDEKQEVISLHSDELSTNHSSSTKSESDSSRNECSIENLNDDDSRLQEDSDNSEDSHSCHSHSKPLLSPENCTNFASVFNTLQVIKEADTRALTSNLHEDIPKPKFDMFSPNKPFKKGSPPTPDFHLCVVGYTDSVPTPRAVRALSEALEDSVPILFGIVSPDSVSFVQLCDVSLPFMAFRD